MKWCIFLISSFAVVYGRPQNSPQATDTSVELEKQTIIEVNPLNKHSDLFTPSIYQTQGKVEDKTKEILEKIAEVNKKQGLKPRREKPNYFHFPFSYSRSQDEEKKSNPRQGNDFKFTLNNMFSNPIFEYLERERNENRNIQLRNNAYGNQELQEQSQSYEKSINPHAVDITKDDVVPGQYIKRKIVHQQTLLVPSQNLYPPLPPNPMSPQGISQYMMQNPVNFPQGLPMQPPLITDIKDQSNVTGDAKNISNLEKQTIDNIKNIVSRTQMLQSQSYPMFYNPYLQYPQGNVPYPYMQYPQGNVPYPYDSMEPNIAAVEAQSSSDDYNYRVYGPYSMSPSDKGRQNWNWPGANYFPIYIRDPFLQMYNAVTSMIEYGPNAGQGGPCKRPPKIKGKEEREGKIAPEYKEHEQITLELRDTSSSPQITIYSSDGDNSENNSSYLDIENIDIGANKGDSLKLTVNLKTKDREGKDAVNNKELKTSQDRVKDTGKSNISNIARISSKLEKFPENNKDFKPPFFIKPTAKPIAKPQSVTSPPIRDPTVHVEELDDDLDEDEKDVSISNDGNKKLFSKDNTGSGIFIHKLKVRKGGVAIAGPGGIATAGSGGTAIVGPNGVAYTQPNSLAIAGSGTKVVAVDPAINLEDLINSASSNGTSSEAFPPSRVGKVVAVGPVVYYNKG